MRPVVKWAGGKRRLAGRLLALMPEGDFNTYAEPFCGGAAVFFELAAQERKRFKKAILADKNEELMALYRALQ
jgi:DNA adenine methylase